MFLLKSMIRYFYVINKEHVMYTQNLLQESKNHIYIYIYIHIHTHTHIYSVYKVSNGLSSMPSMPVL